MQGTKLEVGTFVKVLAGPYEGTEGVLEDVQPECSAVRIGTREGNAYAMLDDLKVIKPLDGKAIKPLIPKR